MGYQPLDKLFAHVAAKHPQKCFAKPMLLLDTSVKSPFLGPSILPDKSNFVAGESGESPPLFDTVPEALVAASRHVGTWRGLAKLPWVSCG